MGTASPRLLKKLVLRTAAATFIGLVFAPTALADDIGIGSTLATVGGTVQGTAPLPQSATQAPATALPAAPSVATPVAALTPTPVVRLQARAESSGVATTSGAAPSVRTQFRPSRSVRRPARPHYSDKASRQFGGGSAPLRTSLSPVQALVARTADFPLRPRSASARARPRPQAPSPPRWPSPFSLGLSGTGSGPAGVGLGLLLLALAAELGVLGAPGLGRRVSLLLAAPRSSPFLLRLERPD
jgi:hypothetical protein